MLKKSLVSLLVGISIVGLVGCGKQETKENIIKQEIISLDKTIKDIDEWKLNYSESSIGVADFNSHKELIKEGTKFMWAIPIDCLFKGQDGKYKCIESIQEFDGKVIIFENLSEIVSDEFIKQTDEDDALLSILEIEKIEKETIYLKINKTVLSKNHMDISEEIELIEVY